MVVAYRNNLIYNNKVDSSTERKGGFRPPFHGNIVRIDATEVSMIKHADLTGQKFGKLTVLKLDHQKQQYTPSGKKHGQRYFWLCQCDCGNQKIVEGRNLLSKHTTSCGCNYYKRGNKTHTRLYKVWEGMIARCYNSNNNRYKNYGAKNIKVCNEWKSDFLMFYNWAMLNGYNENAPRGECTIDRINCNGNYEPNNCRWITNKEQQKNKRNKRNKANGEDVEPPVINEGE